MRKIENGMRLSQQKSCRSAVFVDFCLGEGASQWAKNLTRLKIARAAFGKIADHLRGCIVGILRLNRKDRAYKRTNRYARHDRQRSATTHDRYIRNMREPIGRVPMKSSGVPGERLWTPKAGIVGNYAFRTEIQYGEVVHGWTHCLMTESGETPRRELCDQHIRCARYRYGH